MYAVFVSGGQQHRVKEGDIIKLQKLENGIGDTVDFDQVLMASKDDKVNIGTPYIEKAKISAEVVEQGRHKKVRILKFRRRKHSMKQMGHRQYFTAVKITKIAV